MRNILLYGKKNGGRLALTNSHLYFKFVESLDEDEIVEIEMHPIADERTAKQNRLMWKYLRIINTAYGDYTPSKFHEYFKSKFLSSTVIINKEEIHVVKSTADLSKKEFSEYIERIIQWAAENLNLALGSEEEIKFLREV